MALKFKILLMFVILVLMASCSTVPDIERKHYYSWENDYGYSQVIRAGDTIYISGIASDKVTLTEQIKDIYKYIHQILKDYGVDSDAIVKQVIYTTDIEQMKNHTQLRKSFFNKDKYPSSSIVEVSRL